MSAFMYLFMGSMALAGLTSMNTRRFKRLFATSVFAMLISAYLIWNQYT